MFWHAQHLRNLPDLQAAKQAAYAQQLAADSFGANPLRGIHAWGNHLGDSVVRRCGSNEV
jgi:hypothetical protein